MLNKNALTFWGRIALAACALTTLYAHYAFLSDDSGIKSFGLSVAINLIREALSKPAVLIDVGGQVIAILALYWFAFWAIAVLSRQPTGRERWFHADAFSVLVTWLSCVWLVLRVHNSMFPRSVWAPLLNPETAVTAGYLVTSVSAAWLIWRLWAAAQRETVRAVVIAASMGIPAVLYALPMRSLPATAVDLSALNEVPRNIVVIGLDSMRRDLATTATHEELPHLHAFRSRAYTQANVITPLARTYPAWTSILTGRHPRDTDSRDNLVPQTHLATVPTFARTLQAAGYRTVYTTDETRFSNIGNSFGFDEVISPKPGVADFVVGELSDSPLANLAMQIPGAELLFPSLVGNRAIAHAYYPTRYVRRVHDRLGRHDGRPTLVISHLCTGHWPYFTATVSSNPALKHGSYTSSLKLLDEQFGELMDMLRGQGYINSRTLVVVLADHGEGVKEDFMRAPRIVNHGAEGVMGAPAAGHGGSLLNPAQWQVFTMFAGDTVRGAVPVGRSDQLASLEDIGTAILELSGLEGPSPYRLEVVTRTSGGALPPKSPRQIVAIETGYRPPGLDFANPDRKKAVAIGRDKFNMTADARLEIKPEIYKESVATRDFGVTDGKKALLSMSQDASSLMIAIDFDANTWGLFPSNMATSTEQSLPPLLSDGCTDPDISARIPSWCAALAARQASAPR